MNNGIGYSQLCTTAASRIPAARQICSEMWPGNTTDVNILMPQVEGLRSRFEIGDSCFIADNGMVSSRTIENFDVTCPYVLGTRIRKLIQCSAGLGGVERFAQRTQIGENRPW